MIGIVHFLAVCSLCSLVSLASQPRLRLSASCLLCNTTGASQQEGGAEENAA